MRRVLPWCAAALAAVLLSGCSGGKSGEGAAAGGAGSVGKTSDDAQITQAVQAKLDADPALKAAGIQAKATGGQVQLTGTVKKTEDKDKAENLAWEAIKPFSGVNAGVVDNIQVAESGDTGAGNADTGNKH